MANGKGTMRGETRSNDSPPCYLNTNHEHYKLRMKALRAYLPMEAEDGLEQKFCPDFVARATITCFVQYIVLACLASELQPTVLFNLNGPSDVNKFSS
jgi:hypothetical protein